MFYKLDRSDCGFGSQQVGSGPSVGVPDNLRNATFSGEPPEEPDYALLPLRSSKALDARSSKAVAPTEVFLPHLSTPAQCDIL